MRTSYASKSNQQDLRQNPTSEDFVEAPAESLATSSQGDEGLVQNKSGRMNQSKPLFELKFDRGDKN